MNTRGQYGTNSGFGCTYVGSSLVHTLELKQRYDNAKTGAVATLLRDLSRRGTQSAVGSNRWDVALRDGVWVRLQWYPDWNALEVTISDRELRRVEEMGETRRRYEAILDTITPQLQQHGVTTVGAAYVGSETYYNPAVGITVYHSVGDRADAVQQMSVDWTALYRALATQVGELTVDPAAPSGIHQTTQREWDANPPDPKKVTWWKSYAMPVFRQWNKFKSEQLGGDRTVAADYIAFAERWQTSWDVYEGWKKKLDNLRAEAQKRGFVVDAPKPADLPTTVWADAGSALESGARKVASEFGDVWKIAKYGLIGALGIGAVVALSSVASNLRSGKDPGEKYVDMIRSRRPRAAARAQRALPPGEPEVA